MWTLVITVVLLSQWDGTANATTIHSVPNFASEASCQGGGQQWYESNIKHIRGLKRVTFNCIRN